jgi:hypothetical protein
MQQNYKNIFPELPDHSRVWIYLSNRKFNETESSEIALAIEAFTSSWTSHQNKVKAAGSLLFSQCIVLALDEDVEAVSGCSIDSSVHLIKTLGQKYDVDFFNRLNMLILINDEVKMVNYHELELYEKDKIFNPSIDKLKDLRENWLVPLKETLFI